MVASSIGLARAIWISAIEMDQRYDGGDGF
jgi:hypothetical protein